MKWLKRIAAAAVLGLIKVISMPCSAHSARSASLIRLGSGSMLTVASAAEAGEKPEPA